MTPANFDKKCKEINKKYIKKNIKLTVVRHSYQRNLSGDTDDQESWNLIRQ